jgi:hypothetical protein
MLKINQDELVEIATMALLEVARDSKAPAAARAAASRTLLETTGRIGRLQTNVREGGKPLSEMSAGDLEDEIKRLRILLEPEEPDPFADV